MSNSLNALVGGAAILCVLVPGCADDGQRTFAPRPAPTTQPAPPPAAHAIVALARDTRVESSIEVCEARHTLRGVNLRVADLLSVAYRTPEAAKRLIPLLSRVRVQSAGSLPAGRYDVSVYLPSADAARLRAALRHALREQFGLAAHCERRETDVLVLTAPRGQLTPPPATPDPEPAPGQTRTILTGDDLALLAEQLEERLDLPVVNETGVRASYRLRLVQPTAGNAHPGSNADAVRAALREQLDLDLVRARRAVEYVVVERVSPR